MVSLGTTDKMSSLRKIAKNTSVYFIANLFYYLFTFFTTMYTARYLGADNYGILSIALVFYGIFAVISDFGISTLTTREVAKNKSVTSKFVGNTLVLKLILAIIAIGLIFIIVNLSNYSPVTINTIYIVSLSIIVGVFPGIFSSIFQAYEKMEYPSVNMILTGIFLFLGTLFIIFKGLGVTEFAILNVAVAVIVLVYSLIVYSWRFSLPKIEFDPSFCYKIIKNSIPFGLISLSGMLYTYLDSIILSLLQPMDVVGWYNAAYRLTLVLLFIPAAINVAVFPVMSKYFYSSQNALKLLYERYFKLMLIIGVPIGFGTTLLADKFILLIFGSEFYNSVIILQILVWTMVFTFAGASFVQLFQATNRERYITKISLICVVLNLILNLILIPNFSYIGASFATLFTEIVLVLYIVRVSYKIGYGFPIKKVLSILSKILFSSLVMCILIISLKNLNLIILIILSIFIYFLTLFLVGGIDEDDKNIIQQLTKNKYL
jgi:Membrane protein involved in the export of O-antigen and teichoic acid